MAGERSDDAGRVVERLEREERVGGYSLDCLSNANVYHANDNDVLY